MRTFLGVSKSTCLLAIDGEIGWLPPRYRRQCEYIRLWHRLVMMDTTRLTHRIFNWDMQLSCRLKDTWCNDVKRIFDDGGVVRYFNPDVTKTTSSRRLVQTVKAALTEKWYQQWSTELQQSAKLRTYRTFKNSVAAEEYLLKHLTIKQRSATARFRCGSFPLAIELGRYRRPMTPLENRVCRVCNDGQVEDERHFLLHCSKYDDIRDKCFGQLLSDIVPDRLIYIINNCNSRHLANYIGDAYERRCELLSRD